MCVQNALFLILNKERESVFMNIYDVWHNETERVGKFFDLSYSTINNSIQYRNEDANGTMTVKFNEKERSETLYFRRNNVRGGANKGLGDIVLQTHQGGVNDVRTDAALQMPDMFIRLMNTYNTSERAALRISYDEGKNRADRIRDKGGER